jgi:hypothetical protein
MIKMGVPIPAIKHKLTSVGLNPDMIDFPDYAPAITVFTMLSQGKTGAEFKAVYKASGGASIPMPPPPPPMFLGGANGGIPPPPPPPFLSSVSGGGSAPSLHSALFSSIVTGNFNLKKMDAAQVEKDKLAAAKNNNTNAKNPNGLKAPSLDEITGALAKLRRINTE